LGKAEKYLLILAQVAHLNKYKGIYASVPAVNQVGKLGNDSLKFTNKTKTHWYM
jgi:hypothetical protein